MITTIVIKHETTQNPNTHNIPKFTEVINVPTGSKFILQGNSPFAIVILYPQRMIQAPGATDIVVQRNTFGFEILQGAVYF